MTDTLIKDLLERKMTCLKCLHRFSVKEAKWIVKNHGADILLQCPDCLCSDLMPVINSTNFPKPI